MLVLHRDDGTEPVSLLPDNDKDVRDDIDPSVKGTVPVKLFALSFRLTKFTNSITFDGILPRRLL